MGDNNKANPDPLLDVYEVMDYINFTEGAVRRLIRDGVIPVVKIGGLPKSRIRVRQSALDDLITRSTAPATTGMSAS